MRHIRLMMDFLNYNIKIISKQDIINFLTKDAQIRLALRILVPIAERDRVHQKMQMACCRVEVQGKTALKILMDPGYLIADFEIDFI